MLYLVGWCFSIFNFLGRNFMYTTDSLECCFILIRRNVAVNGAGKKANENTDRPFTIALLMSGIIQAFLLIFFLILTVHLYFKSFSLLWWFENWIVTQIISEVLKTYFFPNAFPQIVAKTLRYILPLVVLFLFLFIWKSLSLLITRGIWLMRTYKLELFANWISTIQSSAGTIHT